MGSAVSAVTTKEAGVTQRCQKVDTEVSQAYLLILPRQAVQDAEKIHSRRLERLTLFNETVQKRSNETEEANGELRHHGSISKGPVEASPLVAISVQTTAV